MSKVAYLAGCMEYAADKGLSWRLKFEEELNKLGIKCIIPNKEEKDLIKGDVKMSELKISDLDRYLYIMRLIIERDLDFVENSDIFIANWNGERGAGTIHEAGYAYQLGKPSYLVSSLKDEDIPGWFLACFVKKFSTLDELVCYLEEKC